MTAPDLQEDCSRCAALCCAAYPFERGHGFGADKPVDTPCLHLSGARCSIHASRSEAGYTGCTAYSCHGAGPYVTEVMFSGATWQDDPGLLPAMTKALRDLAKVQELRALLEAASALPLTSDQETRRHELARALLPVGDWTQGALDAFHAGRLSADTKAFLRSLRSVASDRAADAPRPAEPSGFPYAQPHPRSR